MREILFRGKRRDNGEWVYGLLKYDSAGNPGCICGWVGDSGSETYQEIEVIPETVGQFIGRKDKNGVEICEGDIIQFETAKAKGHSVDNVKANYVIVWASKCNHGDVLYDVTGFYAQSIKSDETFMSISYLIKYNGAIVIGNKFQNPELLTL